MYSTVSHVRMPHAAEVLEQDLLSVGGLVAVRSEAAVTRAGVITHRIIGATAIAAVRAVGCGGVIRRRVVRITVGGAGVHVRRAAACQVQGE